MNPFAPTGRLLIFHTELDWMGMTTCGQKIQQIVAGYRTRRELMDRFDLSVHEPATPNEIEERWIAELGAYASGEAFDFSEFPIELSGKTPFQQAVIRRCQAIPPGETLTYGELAGEAGAPNAARAVGNVMSQNRFLIVVPCHRVVGVNGLGGFSSPQGLDMKRKLLELEARQTAITV